LSSEGFLFQGINVRASVVKPFVLMTDYRLRRCGTGRPIASADHRSSKEKAFNNGLNVLILSTETHSTPQDAWLFSPRRFGGNMARSDGEDVTYGA
jgi:hypothetical protein